MDERVREPCRHCDERVSIAARVCPFCRQDLLVDVRCAGAVEDPRRRYQLARALVAVSPRASVGDVQVALGRGGVLLAHVTRETARAAEAALDGAAAVVVEPSTATAAPPRPDAVELRRSLPILAVVVTGATAALVGGLGAALWATRTTPPIDPERPRPAPLVRAAVSQAPAPTPVPRPSRSEIVRRALRSSVSLRCRDSVASGFYVTRELILTNSHALCDGAQTVAVRLSDGRETSGSTVRVHDSLDLALVRTASVSGEPLPIGDAGAAGIGDPVFAVGSPVGLDFSVSQGTIGSLDRVYYGLAYIQFDASVNPGNSGGPLLDEAGRVIGVVSMKKMDAEGIGLALPINYAYAAPEPVLAAPAGAPPSRGFARLRQSAEARDALRVAPLAQEAGRPVLVDALLLPDRTQMYVALYWRAEPPPRRHRFAFTAWKGASPVCSATVELDDWARVPEPVDLAKDPSPQARAWVASRRVLSDVYRVRGAVPISGCSPADLPDAHLELKDGAPGRRVEIRS